MEGKINAAMAPDIASLRNMTDAPPRKITE
jgi:hypothetical protein